MQIRTIVLSSICAGAMLASSGVAAAQQNDQRPRQKNQQAQDQASQVGRLSQLLDANVETPQGERLGKIENLAVHQPSGQIVYAIISTRGIQGLNNDFKAVPFEALEIDRDQGPIQIDTTRDRFRASPEFSPDGWNTVGDSRWGQIVHQHHGVEFDPSEFTLRDGDDQQIPSQIQLVRAKRMLDMDLKNQQGRDLGDVEDLAINLRNGRVMFVIIDDAAGSDDDHLVAVPWQAIQRQGQSDDALVLNMEPSRLREAPSFEEDRWPNMTAGNFSQQVHAFYGTESDWVYGTDEPQRDPPQDRNDQQADDGHGWLPQDEYGRQFNRDAIETFSGRVAERRFFTPMQGMARGVMLRIERDNGQTVDVHLGPGWYINRQQGNLREGDQVEVTGSRIRGEGGPAYMAIEVRRGDSLMQLRTQAGMPMWDAWRRADASSQSND